MTFKILFWHSNWGGMSYFDIQYLILTFEIGLNIVFWWSKSYFDIRNRAESRILTFKILFWHSKSGRISYFDIQNPILTFEIGPNIVFWYSKSYFDILNRADIVFWYSKSYFDIRFWAEYRILIFKILFCHSNLGQISYFDIQNPILTFELKPNIVFWHSKSYFDIRTGAECRILTFNILF